MLRHKSLIPLSHQHQRALALCVRIERASPVADTALGTWQLEIAQLFQGEIGIHFAAEEQVLFPAARRLPDLVPLVEDLLRDHALLRDSFGQAGAGRMSSAELAGFGQRLAAHIRKEERQLFEGLQGAMTPGELAELGTRLDKALMEADQACSLPTEATRLRPAK